MVCGVQACRRIGSIRKPALKLLLTPRAAQVLVLFEQLLKALKIYLFNPLQSRLLGNKFYRESVGGKELECVLCRKRPLGGKPREFLHHALQGLAEARFFRPDFRDAGQVAELSVRDAQYVGIAHRSAYEPPHDISALDIAGEHAVGYQIPRRAQMVGNYPKSPHILIYLSL